MTADEVRKRLTEDVTTEINVTFDSVKEILLSNDLFFFKDQKKYEIVAKQFAGSIWKISAKLITKDLF